MCVYAAFLQLYIYHFKLMCLFRINASLDSRYDLTSLLGCTLVLTLGTGTLVNCEDPGEMPHNAAFHQGLHCLPR